MDAILLKKNNSDRYILELYPNYLNELHESHNYYPLAPERLEISHIMLLEYCSNIANKYGIPKFQEFDWLKQCIGFNIQKRKHAANGFEKYFWMNNSIFGKTMENLRKIMNVRLVNNARDHKKICKQTKFCFTENSCCFSLN